MTIRAPKNHVSVEFLHLNIIFLLPRPRKGTSLRGNVFWALVGRYRSSGVNLKKVNCLKNNRYGCAAITGRTGEDGGRVPQKILFGGTQRQASPNNC